MLTMRRNCSRRDRDEICAPPETQGSSLLPGLLLLALPFDAADRVVGLRRRWTERLRALARVLKNAPMRHWLDQQLGQPPHQSIEPVRRVACPSPVKVRGERAHLVL